MVDQDRTPGAVRQPLRITRGNATPSNRRTAVANDALEALVATPGNVHALIDGSPFPA